MPVIIDEIIFRAEIAPARSDRARAPAESPASAGDRREIIEACVDEVMRILERKRER